MRRASQWTSSVVPRPKSGAKKRMPNSVWPNIAVPARMMSAMPGPLLKYHQSSRWLHSW